MVQRTTDSTYMVECFWPDVREDQVAQAAKRLEQSATQLTGNGQLVDFAGSILVPGDEVVFYLFEAVSVAAVEAACVGAGLKFERVVASVRRGSAS